MDHTFSPKVVNIITSRKTREYCAVDKLKNSPKSGELRECSAKIKYLNIDSQKPAL